MLATRGGWIAWVSPPYTPYAPALAVAGIDVARVLVVGHLRPAAQVSLAQAQPGQPARRQPAESLEWLQVALKPSVTRLADSRGLAEQPVGLVGLAHVPLLQQADLAAR